MAKDRVMRVQFRLYRDHPEHSEAIKLIDKLSGYAGRLDKGIFNKVVNAVPLALLLKHARAELEVLEHELGESKAPVERGMVQPQAQPDWTPPSVEDEEQFVAIEEKDELREERPLLPPKNQSQEKVHSLLQSVAKSINYDV